MRSNSRKAFSFILLLVLSSIDQVFCASLKADGDKGQPEMVQPLDNHPMEWTVDKGESAAAIAAEYRYLLMQRTDDLLTEALDMLGRVKDGQSRRWLEAFIYKMGELAVQLGGKHHQRKAESSTTPSQVLPTPQPVQAKVTPMKPIKNDFENQVTSTQLNNVLPSNEAILDRQVVTRPGFADGDFEDELVRQLHDQERIMRREETEKNMKASDSLAEEPDSPTEASELPKSIQSDINNLVAKDDEKQMLMDLANELNELSDLDVEERSLKENHNVADLSDEQPSQKKQSQEKNEFEIHDQLKTGNEMKNRDEKKMSGFYFRGAIVSAKGHDSTDQSLAKMKPENFKESFENPEKNNQTPKTILLTQSNWHQSPTVNNLSGESNGQTLKSVKNQFPHKNYFYYSNTDKLVDTQTLKQVDRFQNKNMFKQYPSQKDFSKTSGNSQNKDRHPMLQDMLLKKHGHNALRLHLNPTKNIMDVYDSKTDIKTHNISVFESTAISSHPHTHPQSNALKQQSGIREKQGNFRPILRSVRDNSNVLGKVMKKNNQNRLWNTMQENGASADMGNFHFDQVSFPNQLQSDPHLQHKMERQLRAGKVVMLSDSLVKANFNKNAIRANNTKMNQNHGPLN